MKRPCQQARLLFVYLLRSSAHALARNNPYAYSTTSSAAAAAEGHICLRLARKTDVGAISRCNVATLPENYHANFYHAHMREWPDLALVAEHVVPKRHNRYYSEEEEEEPNIVGYVLGKIEDRYIPCRSLSFPPSPGAREYLDDRGERHVLSPTGHVTSIAVLPDYRKRGLATSLLSQLHTHLEYSHRVQSVGLHVRQGNAAATRLYEQKLGYHVEQVLDHYYADGEPAYYMMRRCQQHQQIAPHSLRSLLMTSRDKPWNHRGGPWQLPRAVWEPQPHMKPQPDDDAATVLEGEEEVQGMFMTGT
eukprot:CAMPEP_0194223804 /NCGR_PEP_ID=MMETSP0156-20130528/35990_1 /TAXON_ID=33649 /ORGANISM="Thalassionema nitzschioides, Strain L26-B" /LENGTH=304 /DNA_ID=CAMNT_0038955083 /DNA_START=133 /DNA_END=1047 /DNA_ORIENTATION=-